MSEITLKNVSKKYGNGNFAVREFNLDIHDKEFIIFVGRLVAENPPRFV